MMFPMYLSRFASSGFIFLCVYITINNDIANAANDQKLSTFKNQFLLLSQVKFKKVSGKSYWRYWKLIKSKIWNRYFYFLASFWLATLKPFFGKDILQKWKKLIQRLNPKIITGSILQNSFEATWRCKLNVLRVQMWHFHFFL